MLTHLFMVYCEYKSDPLWVSQKMPDFVDFKSLTLIKGNISPD